MRRLEPTDAILEVDAMHGARYEWQLLSTLVMHHDARGIPETILGSLHPEHFGSTETRAVYRAILELRERNSPILPDLVVGCVRQNLGAQQCMSSHWLHEQLQIAHDPQNAIDAVVQQRVDNLIHEAEQREERETRRRLEMAEKSKKELWRKTAFEIGGGLKNEKLSLADVHSRLAETERKCREIDEDADPEESKHGPSALLEVLDQIRERGRGHPDGDVIRTGFPSLDEAGSNGFVRGDLCLLAGASSSGKTTMSTTCIRTALDNDHRVLWVNYDQSSHVCLLQIATRILGTNFLPLRSGHPMPSLEHLFDEERELLRRLPIEIVDGHSLPLRKLEDFVARSHQRQKIDLLVIDHLHHELLSPANEEGGQNASVKKASATLGGMAKRHDCVVLALAQLTKQAAARDQDFTNLDIRDSAAIVENAEIVAILGKHKPATNAPWRTAQLTITKARFGGTGKTTLRFDPEIARFMEVGRHSSEAPVIDYELGRRF